MNVLFITDPNIIGGATKSLVELVHTLTEEYNVNIVVCTSKKSELNKKLDVLRIKNIVDGHIAVMEVPPNNKSIIRHYCRHVAKFFYFKIKTYLAYKSIISQININDIDIIHTNSARNDIGCLLSKKHRIPHIMHIREFGEEDFGCWYLRINYFKYINKYVDRFIAISNAVKDSWTKKGIDKEKITVIYNGVDAKKIKESSSQEKTVTDILQLVMTGGICHPKGQYQVIEAIALLPERIRKKVYFDMFGWADDNYIDNLLTRAKDLEINTQIRWLGTIDDVGSVLANYDVGLTCSKAEGFGRITAEYMHAGLGIIVSNTGANSELIEDHVNGLIYQYNNVKDLSLKIEEYYNDRQLLASCGKKAKEIAAKKYTREENAKNVKKVYDTLICK